MSEYEIAVIGGGGAGLTAGMYTARADLKTVIFEKDVTGGQISKTDLVENFPGHPEGISGTDISMKMEEHAVKNQAQIKYESVLSISKTDSGFQIKTDMGEYSAKVVILAMGAVARRLGVTGEDEFTGKGVSYCATCDAPFFRGKKVAVIGGGDSAIQEALFLTKFAEKVVVVHRRDELRAGAVLKERAVSNEKISFEWNAVVDSVQGEATLKKIVLKDTKTGDLRDLDADGMFVFIGHDPNSELVKDLVDLDEEGYVLADKTFAASEKGIFVCGELRSGAVWQLAAACGEGCSAAVNAEKYLDNINN